MSLQGKIALVTGGSRGIGRAVSQRLARDGAYVLVNYVGNREAAEATVAEIKGFGGEAAAVQFNVADTKETEEALSRILEQHGRVDILVNNAGITRDTLFLKMKDEQWQEVLATNLTGAFVCIRALARPMMKNRWGRIINITSVVGFTGNAGQANYASAKAGMVGLTRSVARELASRNITVNAVAPGYIVTDMTSHLPEQVTDRIKGEIPMGSLGAPEDVAGAVSYLASEEARYVTGQCIHVNGGMYMG